MTTKDGGFKLNGTSKVIVLIILIIGSTVSIVASIEGMRGDIRVNTTQIELLRESNNKLEARVNEHIEKDK